MGVTVGESLKYKVYVAPEGDFLTDLTFDLRDIFAARYSNEGSNLFPQCRLDYYFFFSEFKEASEIELRRIRPESQLGKILAERERVRNKAEAAQGV